mgnify:CR=1 FL=1|jgi:hypothetical protein
MLAELDLALSKPTELIQQLFEQHGSLDGLEQVICDRFTSLIKDGGALAQVRASKGRRGLQNRS